MQGFISIDIPTKSYIKAYIIHKLGPKPYMSKKKGDTIAHKFYDILEHKTNERKKEFSRNYKEYIRVYIPIRTFERRGHLLNEDNIKNFNRFVEKELKQKFYFLMDNFLEQLPNFESNLPEVRKKLGIDIEAWSDDSMRKDYYRYRKNTQKDLLYKKQ